MTELGIYGGAFSPPHIGHIRAAHAFMEQVELDKLMIIPTYVSPHKKYISANGAEDGDIRLEMLKIAFETDENGKKGKLEVSPCEIIEKRPSYTVYTLRRFASPDTRITLLCGTDMFLTLETWFEAAEIFKLARIALIRREKQNYETEKQIKEATELFNEKYGADIIQVIAEPFEVSSTEIRDALISGENVDRFLPKKLADYIRNNGYYGAIPEGKSESR